MRTENQDELKRLVHTIVNHSIAFRRALFTELELIDSANTNPDTFFIQQDDGFVEYRRYGDGSVSEYNQHLLADIPLPREWVFYKNLGEARKKKPIIFPGKR